MTTTHSTDPAPARVKARGFVAATVSFVSVFAAGATPIPLYDTYRTVNGLTNDEFSLVAVAYFACAVFALLILGRLSNHHGRRPIAIAALLLAVAGCITLLFVHSFLPLLIGRSLQGLAAGLASSAIGAYVVDTAPRRPNWLVPAVTTAAATVGLALGVFISGALVEFAPVPRELPFWVFAVVLLGCAIGLATHPETVARTGGAWLSLIPRLAVPQASRRYLPVASGVFVATWAFGGYFTSFGPSIAAEDLGSHSPLAAATVFASYMAPSFLGGFIAGRFTPAAAQRIGMTFVAAAGVGLAYAGTAGILGLFIVAGVVGGIGMGIATSGSMNTLLPEALPRERAGLLAVIYAISYTGSAVPSLIAGQASRTVSLPTITLGYTTLAVLVWITTLIAARNPPKLVAFSFSQTAESDSAPAGSHPDPDDQSPIPYKERHMTKTMTALFGGAGPYWEARAIAVPEPEPGQVLVRTRAVSLNNADVQMLAAADPASGSDEAYLAGFEFAGEITAIGEGADGVSIGQRVMGTTRGAFAQYVLADHRHIMTIPEGVAYEEASALPTGLLTEHGALTVGGFVPDQSVLITGATSSIGLIGIQIAKSLGAKTVIATTRTESKKELLSNAGADVVIATSGEDLTAAVLEATEGQGVDIVLDHVGGQTLAACLPATRVDGQLVNIGRLDQADSTINLDALSYRHLRLTGVSFGFTRADELAHVIAALAPQVLAAVAQGRVRPIIDSILPFDQANEAADRMRGGNAHGKIILTVP